MTRQSVINLSVIGLGPDWESHYGPAVAKLSRRIRVHSVYDVTAAKAEDAARSVDAIAARGLRQMLSAQDLNAVLLLHLGWQSEWLLETACRAGLPLFVGEHVLRTPGAFDRLEELLPLAEEIIVPEQPIRYLPSMLRLRELMATQLGSIQTIHINLPRSQSALGEQIRLPDLLSWCCVAFGLRSEGASRVSENQTQTDPDLRRLTIPSRHQRQVALEVRLSDSGVSSSSAPAESVPVADPLPFCRIVSANGQVELLGPRELRWDTGEGTITEQLQADRSAIDVMLDLFTRRAAGGLIPVADLPELRRGERLASLVLA